MLKKTNKFGIGKFLVMAMVLGGGLVYGAQMVQKNQDNRSSAAGTQISPCRCSKSIYKTQSLCVKAKGIWVCPKITTKPTATPTPSPKKTCTTGQKLCKGNVLMMCQNNTWVIIRTCDNSCGNGECIPKVTTPTPKNTIICSSGHCDKCGSAYDCSRVGCSWDGTKCKSSTVSCTSVMYSTWSPCKDGKQTRSIWEKNPSGCTVENPVLSQSCSNL